MSLSLALHATKARKQRISGLFDIHSTPNPVFSFNWDENFPSFHRFLSSFASTSQKTFWSFSSSSRFSLAYWFFLARFPLVYRTRSKLEKDEISCNSLVDCKDALSSACCHCLSSPRCSDNVAKYPLLKALVHLRAVNSLSKGKIFPRRCRDNGKLLLQCSEDYKIALCSPPAKRF